MIFVLARALLSTPVPLSSSHRDALRTSSSPPPPKAFATQRVQDMGRKNGSHGAALDDTTHDYAPLVPWKSTKIMNARDLARDDDFLSHIFIEKLGSTGVGQQLLVHRMDPRRRLPKTDTATALAIVQRVSRLPHTFTLTFRALNADQDVSMSL